MIPQSALPDCPGTPRTSVSALLNSGYQTNKALKKMESTSENRRRYPEKYPTIPPLDDLYTQSLPVYDDPRGVRNLYSGHRTRQICGFFVPVILGVIAPACPINGREGTEIPEYRPPPVAVLNLPTALHRGSPFNLRNYRSASHGQ